MQTLTLDTTTNTTSALLSELAELLKKSEPKKAQWVEAQLGQIAKQLKIDLLKQDILQRQEVAKTAIAALQEVRNSQATKQEALSTLQSQMRGLQEKVRLALDESVDCQEFAMNGIKGLMAGGPTS